MNKEVYRNHNELHYNGFDGLSQQVRKRLSS